MNVSVLRDLLPAAATEYEKASNLHDSGFVTEAGLRLGRAVEAALYSIARDLDVSLTDKVIEDIENIRKALAAKSVVIMRKAGDANQVRSLSDVSKSLSEAIASLIEDDNLRMGAPSTEPRRIDALLRDLLQVLENADTKAKLNRQQSVLMAIRVARNKAAHADPSGYPRELSEEEYQGLFSAVKEFLAALVNISIGVRASKQSCTPENA